MQTITPTLDSVNLELGGISTASLTKWGRFANVAFLRIKAHRTLSQELKVRWAQALMRALRRLNDPKTLMDEVGAGEFCITHPESEDVYLTSIEECTCPAGRFGHPCWHRAGVGLERMRRAEVKKGFHD